VSARAKVTADQFEQTLRDVVAEARGSAGCLRYDWFRSPEIEREVFIYAEFESADAFAEYRSGPVVKKIGAHLLPLLEARPSFKHLQASVLEQG
jgi:quinol monooxygenase YgiN